MDKPEQSSLPPRLVPDLRFPPYSYVPGQSPHPTSDPRGHSFGVAPPQATAPPDPERWHECRPYLVGLDLFNHGYYWEAHEAWEAVWHACGRTGPTADCLKGLIKLAAAGVKSREGRPDGVRSHARRAAALFRGLIPLNADDARYLGLSLTELANTATAIGDEGWPGSPPVLHAMPLPADRISSLSQ